MPPEICNKILIFYYLSNGHIFKAINMKCRHINDTFVTACFAKAFQRVPRSMSSSVASAMDMMTGSITTLSEARTLMYVFEVNLEIKEDDGKVRF